MTAKELEQRLTALERQVQQLSEKLTESNSKPNKRWLDSIRKYAGDEDLLSIFADAQKLREADRRKARQRPSANRKSK
jgi:hypothetical protein